MVVDYRNYYILIVKVIEYVFLFWIFINMKVFLDNLVVILLLYFIIFYLNYNFYFLWEDGEKEVNEMIVKEKSK